MATHKIQFCKEPSRFHEDDDDGGDDDDDDDDDDDGGGGTTARTNFKAAIATSNVQRAQHTPKTESVKRSRF